MKEIVKSKFIAGDFIISLWIYAKTRRENKKEYRTSEYTEVN